MRIRALSEGLSSALWAAPILRTPVDFTQPRSTRGRRTLHALLAASACAVAVGSAVQLSLASGVTLWPTVAVTLMLSVPLLLVPRAPLLTWRAMTLGLFASNVLVPVDSNYWPWPVTAFVVYLGVIFLVALTYRGATLGAVAFLSCALTILPAGPPERMDDGVIYILFGLVLLVVFLGGSIRQERRTKVRLADEIAQHRADLVRATILAERTHIARELHDVVAHHMSLVAIQADVAPHRIKDLPPEAADTFLLVRDTAREALAEMRRLVGGLRDSGDADYAPQPGISEINDLVAAVRRTGTDVVLSLPTQEVSSAPVAISAHRIVQQCLANAVQHAVGAQVSVAVAVADGNLEITVENGPGEHTDAVPDAPHGLVGQGLVGMRERAVLLGGSFDASPTANGGFRVRATLPLDPSVTNRPL